MFRAEDVRVCNKTNVAVNRINFLLQKLLSNPFMWLSEAHSLMLMLMLVLMLFSLNNNFQFYVTDFMQLVFCVNDPHVLIHQGVLFQ
jgi:hypothetical protein